MSFALSSLVSVTEEQLEALGDDELALVISWFLRFHNNHLNHRRAGGPKEGCYGYGDSNHFVAHCPKKNKNSSDKYDSSKRKDKREYTSKHKSKEGFDKEALKKRFLKKAKAQQHAFLVSLSDLDDSGDKRASLSSSDDEHERKVEERLDGLYFFTDSTHGGFCTMALGDEETSKDEAIGDDDTPEVLSSADKLAAEVDALSDAMLSQDTLLKRAAHERKEYKDNLEHVLKDLGLARSSMSVIEEIECHTCAIHMSSLVTLQNKYGTLLDEHDELKARSVLLGAYKSCSGLQSGLAEKNAKI